MPKISKSSDKKVTVKKNKTVKAIKKPIKVVGKANKTEKKIKAPIKISKNYIPKDTRCLKSNF